MPKMIPGILFPFGSEDLVVPPLALGDLELLQERLAAMQLDAMNRESMGTIIDATHAALQRNYPALTREAVGRLIDLGNMADVIQCVMDISGVKRKSLESEQGKVPAVWAETASS